jgi:hypothetical protein
LVPELAHVIRKARAVLAIFPATDRAVLYGLDALKLVWQCRDDENVDARTALAACCHLAASVA